MRALVPIRRRRSRGCDWGEFSCLVGGGQREPDCVPPSFVGPLADLPLPVAPVTTLGLRDESDCIPEDHGASTCDELHQQRRRRGYAKLNSKSVPQTRPSTMGALDRNRKRGTQEELPDVAGKRNRVEELHLACVLRQRSQWWDSPLKEPGVRHSAPPWMGPPRMFPLRRPIVVANPLGKGSPSLRSRETLPGLGKHAMNLNG